MKLNELEHGIDPIIYNRGQQYRENGHILTINEIEPHVYYAEIVGSDLYDVKIKLNTANEVIFTSCECFNDDIGPYCKHVVAALLEINDKFPNKKPVLSIVRKSTAPKMNVADQLSKLSKDELITLLVHLSTNIEEVDQAIQLKLIDFNNNDGLKQYK
ncbi:SWIM zinc finger family protein [Paenibacillus sp. GSMTC-2017]|uniref:SWIM zinc finger family protein n=1 Tax=Paenibacillus sp. GSMTC-2017 TaxID=2794350 RepID=UPI0018D96AE2|nr:SWIM zinc finger family protein [Paenibacillus sp. GSMTC-2017]MBH5320905.1 SWIM zinc finger family protein [Paenibacillus sp. GSMTC-2017]